MIAIFKKDFTRLMTIEINDKSLPYSDDVRRIVEQALKEVNSIILTNDEPNIIWFVGSAESIRIAYFANLEHFGILVRNTDKKRAMNAINPAISIGMVDVWEICKADTIPQWIKDSASHYVNPFK